MSKRKFFYHLVRALPLILAFVVTNLGLKLFVMTGFLAHLPQAWVLLPGNIFNNVIPGCLTELPLLVGLALLAYGLGRGRNLLAGLLTVVNLAGYQYFVYAVDWFTVNDLYLLDGASGGNSLALIDAIVPLELVGFQLIGGLVSLFLLKKYFTRRLGQGRSLVEFGKQARRALKMLGFGFILALILVLKPWGWYTKYGANPVIKFVSSGLEKLLIPTAPLDPNLVIQSLTEDGLPDHYQGYEYPNPNDPLIRVGVETDKTSSDAPQHLVFFILESLSHQILEVEGLAPNFKKFKSSSLVFNNCFANGFPTARGHEAIFYSSYPPRLDGYEFAKHREPSLPLILARAGYQTAIFTANEHEQAKARRFYQRAGFSLVVDPAFLGIAEKADQAAESIVLNQINEFFSNQAPKGPVCLTFVSAIGHAPFRFYPKITAYPKLYPASQNLEEAYANQMHLVLESIAELIAKIQACPEGGNTIFVITGDHGPHATLRYERLGLEPTPSQLDFYELQRIPLIINGPRLPEVDREQLAGQIDIAPSLLDLIGLNEGMTRFLGKSLFRAQTQAPERLLLLNHKHALTREFAIDEDQAKIFSLTERKEIITNLQLVEGVKKTRASLELYRRYYQDSLSAKEF